MSDVQTKKNILRNIKNFHRVAVNKIKHGRYHLLREDAPSIYHCYNSSFAGEGESNSSKVLFIHSFFF